MTTTIRNEAVDRLMEWVNAQRDTASRKEVGYLLGAALAAERRATVERIRERVVVYVHDGDPWLNAGDLFAVLDEEAAR